MLVLVLFMLVLLLLTHRVWMMPQMQPVFASQSGVRYSQEHALAMESVHHTFACTNTYALQSRGKNLLQSDAMRSWQLYSLNTVLASSPFTSQRTQSTRLKQSNAIRDKPCGSSRRSKLHFQVIAKRRGIKNDITAKPSCKYALY